VGRSAFSRADAARNPLLLEQTSRRAGDAGTIGYRRPYIFVIDVLENPQDFRFRLAGTHFREAVGEEVTGKHIAAVFPPAFGAEVHQIWSRVVDERRPVRGMGDLWVPGREFVKWEGLVMPLSADGHAVNMLLGGVVFHQLARKKP
jgi:hypothetical protein